MSKGNVDEGRENWRKSTKLGVYAEGGFNMISNRQRRKELRKIIQDVMGKFEKVKDRKKEEKSKGEKIQSEEVLCRCGFLIFCSVLFNLKFMQIFKVIKFYQLDLNATKIPKAYRTYNQKYNFIDLPIRHNSQLANNLSNFEGLDFVIYMARMLLDYGFGDRVAANHYVHFYPSL